MRLPSVIRLGLCLFLLTVSSLSFAQFFNMVDLGTPPGDGFAVPRGINASGQVTGAAGPANGETSSVFRYSNGTFTNLGTLGGNSGIGNSINKYGQIAGYSQDSAGRYRAFITHGNTLVDIGDLGGGSAVAYGINDAGDAVGSAVTADGSNHPFLYSGGKMSDLGTLGSPEGSQWWNSAEGINNSAVVIGYGYTNQINEPVEGFASFNGKMIGLGSLGGDMSQAYAINNHNQITGIAYLPNGAAHAFIMGPSQPMKDLGALQDGSESLGFAINDSGIVVGQSQLSNGDVHAMVYNGTKMYDLNTLVPKSNLTLIEARGINNSGQIVCTGLDSQGNSHTVLLTPR